MNRRNVKLLLLASRRREQQTLTHEAVLGSPSQSQAAAANGGTSIPSHDGAPVSRPRRSSPPVSVSVPTEPSVSQEEEKEEEDYEEESRIVEAAVRLVGLEDNIMFQSCMSFI